MYVWELVACRLRSQGWDIWHCTEAGPGADPTYHVHLRRDEFSAVLSGPTLTEAYAVAARHARDHSAPSLNPPHFGRTRSASRH